MQNLVAPIFQKGSDGDSVLSSSAAINGVYSAVTGTQYSTSLAVTSPGSFAAGDIVLIHQTRGSNALASEWNVIQSINGGASPFTMAIPLSNTYIAGAQMIKFPKYRSFTENSGVNINVNSWDGSRYGIGGLFCSGTAVFNGTVNMNGLGFRAGNGAGGSSNTTGFQGEGTLGAGSQTTNSNGNGGGGGGYSTNAPWNQGNGAGGGANAANNSQGGTRTGGGNDVGGAGGSVGQPVALPNLDTFSLGGAGGGGGDSNGTPGTNGGNGGGAFIVIAKRIVLAATASFTANGNNGSTANYQGGCGGSGAGGSLLFICEELVWNSGAVITASGGAHIRNNNHSGVDGDSDGGSGGDGRVAVQCGKITNASGAFASTPTYNNNGFSKFCARIGAAGF